MDIDGKINLIKKDSIDIIGENELRKLFEENKNISCYIGRAPTGSLHLGHIVPLSKIFDFQKAGVKAKILIADLHAALDDQKAPWDQIEKRAKFTKKCIELSLPWKEKPEFIIGSSYQLSEKYQLDIMKMSSLVTVKRATRAASEVTRMKDTKVSELIYPVMQALDEEYLKVDMQFGGVDQRHIMALAREYLPKLGYKSRAELMFPLIQSLKGPGAKMSSSIPDSIIKIYDSEKSVTDKIRGAYCLEGEIKDNPILQLCQKLIFPIKGIMKIERPIKFGGNIEFANYVELETAFGKKALHPLDLKNALTRELIDIFKPVRTYFEKHLDELKELGPQFLP
jgi:tyrosyl-tRNA synthetase